MDELEFKSSLIVPAWMEVSYLINSGKAYVHKQDRISVFYNAFRYIEIKAEAYYDRQKKMPINTLNELVYAFRQAFPVHGREGGVNYFDDLIEAFIERNKTRLEFTHRERAYADILKESFEGISIPPRKERKPKGYETAIDSFNPKSKNYKKDITTEELKNVILILKKGGFQKAQTEAENQLMKMLL